MKRINRNKNTKVDTRKRSTNFGRRQSKEEGDPRGHHCVYAMPGMSGHQLLALQDEGPRAQDAELGAF